MSDPFNGVLKGAVVSKISVDYQNPSLTGRVMVSIEFTDRSNLNLSTDGWIQCVVGHKRLGGVPGRAFIWCPMPSAPKPAKKRKPAKRKRKR